MSEIPEDIVETAERLWKGHEGESGPSVIARAVMAERERCWFIVKEKAEGDVDFAAFLIMKGDA